MIDALVSIFQIILGRLIQIRPIIILLFYIVIHVMNQCNHLCIFTSTFTDSQIIINYAVLFKDLFISSHLWKCSKRAMSRCCGAIFTALGRALPTNDHATSGGNLIFGRQTASVRYGTIHFISISEGR